MSNIRVTYSGLISFAIGIITVITGLVFTLIVTRQLSQEEFGTWGLIGTLVGYVLVMNPVISYWNTREIARGEESGKTAMFSTAGFSSIGIFVYIGIVILMAFQEGIEFNLLILAIILIPVEYFRMTLNAISLGFKPQISEYGLLVFELTKIPLGFLMVVYWEMGLEGAIIAVALATVANILILIIKTREKIKTQFNIEYLKKWLKLFWLPTFPKIGQVLFQSEVIAYTLISGSVSGLAYWTASKAIAKIVRHSLRVNKALYPKLLSGGQREYFQDNIVTVFYFAFPLIAMAIVFSRPALFLLNPIYEIAWLIAIISTFTVFLRSLEDIFKQSLTGIEKIDTSKTSTFQDYLKSKLFFVPLVTNIHRAIYIVILVIVLILSVSFVESEIELVTYWVLVSLFTQLPFTIYLYLLVRKEFKPKINLTRITKYLGASVISFGIVFYFMEEFLVYEISIYQFLPEFLKYVLFGGVLYLGITYAIDKKTRELVISVLKEYKK